MTNLDLMIEDFARQRRHRMVLVVAAVIGIVAGSMIGLGATLVGVTGAGGARNPAMLAFFLAPFAATMAIGYAVYGALRLYARLRPATVMLPRATLYRR